MPPPTRDPSLLPRTRNFPMLPTSIPERQATAEAGNARLGVGALLRKRARYVARFIYYVAVHRGFKHAAWACGAEGVEWN
jgi:hypothetical protein